MSSGDRRPPQSLRRKNTESVLRFAAKNTTSNRAAATLWERPNAQCIDRNGVVHPLSAVLQPTVVHVLVFAPDPFRRSLSDALIRNHFLLGKCQDNSLGRRAKKMGWIWH